MATVRVRRRADGKTDLLRRYRVALDGREIGMLRRGGWCEATVETGNHRLEVQIDWVGSGCHDFALDPGDMAEFECWGPESRWAGLRRMLFAPSTYLQLCRSESA